MSYNPAGAREIAISVFGGLCTEMIGQTLPDGVSPDNQDVEFVPGAVYSRRGLQRQLASGFPAGAYATYGKSYVDPLGVIRNLYLDSKGTLWMENLNTGPGTISSLGSFTPGSYAKSITAFGREYIAISDTAHGSDIPLQYDGTNLDRITQDGPGGPPSVTSFAYPAVLMQPAGSTPPSYTINGIFPDQNFSGYWQVLNIYLASGWGSVPVGATVTIAGTTSTYNGTYTVTADPGPGLAITVACSISSSAVPYVGGGTLSVTSLSGATMVRGSNIVTVQTAAAHNLEVGYQVQITGVPPSPVGTNISSVVIANSEAPGIATITTTSIHGLAPGDSVSLVGIGASVVGGSITGFAWNSNIGTFTTASAHNLAPGSFVTVTGSGSWTSISTTVLAVADATHFTLALVDNAAPAGTPNSVALEWPVADTPDPTYYTVESAPTPTKFQVQVNYSDGAWGAGGLVYFAWDGTYFVRSVPDSTHFTYQQYGPDSTANTVGTVTPFGQVSPGQHQCQVLFLTRNGYLTRPSPPRTFMAEGGQYINITDIPIGPSNVTARVLAFTGAQGAYFFYIPNTPQVNGIVVGTATQINDNTTTAAVLDFSDNTLFADIGISIPGNMPANQIVIDGALGFAFYASRIITWGQRNRIQNFLNLGFDGGAYPSQPTLPTGWYLYAGTTGALAAGHYGQGWKIPVLSGNNGLLYQPAAADAYGAPILTAGTNYKLRVWLKPDVAASDLNFNCWINSPSTGFTSKAVIPASAMSTSGSYVELPFDTTMPSAIPPDMQLEIFAQATSTAAGNLLVDEISILYAQQPYLDQVLYGSYADNPEAFDGVSGKFGSAQDVRQVMDVGVIRQSLYFLTREPSGRLHQTNDNGVTEPAGWNVYQVAANCGLVSAFALTKSQSDDASAAGGEEWFAWASASGPRIFGGSEPWKIGQEIQPNWTGDRTRNFQGMNFPTMNTSWALNDPKFRMLYFGIPSLDATAYPRTATPNLILVMNYRELENAMQIFSSGPIHTSITGRLIATDHTRKWTRWNLPINRAALMYRSPTSDIEVVLLGGSPS